jgi:hypothetical protein
MRPTALKQTQAKTFDFSNSAFLKPRVNHILGLVAILFLSSCSGYKSAVDWTLSENQRQTINSFRIPIHRFGKLLLLKGVIKGETGYFIFDTGAPGLVLNEQYFKNYYTDPTRQVTGVNGQIHDARVCKVGQLQLGDVVFKIQKADVTNLKHIEKKRNVKILGLMGVNLFWGLELEIDLHQEELRIYKTDQQGQRLADATSKLVSGQITMPFKFRGSLIELQANINDHYYRIAFDSGSEILLFDKELVIRDNIETRLISLKSLLGIDGSKPEIELRQIENIKIGLSLNKITTMLIDFKNLRSHGLNVDGVIGYDLMTMGVVTINFRTRNFQIKPYCTV